MELVTIEIENWDKYNPKRDQTTYSWLRLNNDIVTDKKLFGLDAEQRFVWIAILCDASKENSAKVEVDLTWLEDHTKVSRKKIESLIEFLEFRGVIKVHDIRRPPIVAALHQTTPTNVTNVTNERTNERDGSDIATPVAQVKAAFQAAYQSEFRRTYPGWGKKENGQASTWLKSISLEKAIELCRIYPRWNDPWVTKQGHPFGVLVSQYVQCDAWARSSKQLIQKIAQGKAAENVDLKRAIDLEEMKRGLQERQRSLGNEDARLTGPVQGQLQITPAPGVSSVGGHAYGAQIPNMGAQANARASGIDS